jgi:hypothetical protein
MATERNLFEKHRGKPVPRDERTSTEREIDLLFDGEPEQLDAVDQIWADMSLMQRCAPSRQSTRR